MQSNENQTESKARKIISQIRENEIAEIILYLDLFICSGIVLGFVLFFYFLQPIRTEPAYLIGSSITAPMNQWLVYFSQLWVAISIPVIRSWPEIHKIKRTHWYLAFGINIVISIIFAFGIIVSAKIILNCPPNMGINPKFTNMVFDYLIAATISYSLLSLTLWFLPKKASAQTA